MHAFLSSSVHGDSSIWVWRLRFFLGAIFLFSGGVNVICRRGPPRGHASLELARATFGATRAPVAPRRPAMKFGKLLQFSSVPEWRQHYMSYRRLKRILKRLGGSNSDDEEDEDPASAQDATSAQLRRPPSTNFLADLPQQNATLSDLEAMLHVVQLPVVVVVRCPA